MNPDTTPAVYGAVAKVMATLAKSGISKDRKNQQQGYAFRGIDDVYNALAPALVDAGLIVIPAVLSRTCEERQSAKGGALFYVTVTADFVMIAVADGSSVKAGPFYGEAMDSGDKATNKAMSAAYKYWAMQTFAIPTDTENDADYSTHEVMSRRGAEQKPVQQPPTAKALTTGEFGKHKNAVMSAADELALRKAFATAYTAAQKLGDHDAAMRLKECYDARKAELDDAAKRIDEDVPQ